MCDCERKDLQACDMIQASSHIVVFEAFDSIGRVDNGPSLAFQAKLMDALVGQLPSIAIQAEMIAVGTFLLNILYIIKIWIIIINIIYI